ncbi:ATP-binding protein [Desulfosediminicola ganghwensis]|uniref:ATP-binding protein n=1 Tax=Desulfosediminicola ganghwensis TaxID=2569540 RepID=UPI0010AB5AA9|nr:ATP-binding protein [Desulfosediminicola ganghwensis]
MIDSNCSSVLVVIPNGCKILLIVAARLLALLNQLIYIGKKVTVDLTECASTKLFLSRAGFFDHLDDQVQVVPDRPRFSGAARYKGNSDALVEFGAIDPNEENKDLVVQLQQRFVQQSDARYEIAALTVFGELIGNVFEHSESPIFGFASLQRYVGRRKHIQTVVSDSGLGIARTLRPSLQKHHPKLYKRYKEESLESDVGLVQTALTEGGISRFGSGRGLGFESSRKQAMKFDAELTVRQERFCLNFEYKEGELVRVTPVLDLPRILGSHFCFDFFVDPE